MNIKINDNTKIRSIQEQFNNVFPYLRIEFFSKSTDIHRDPPFTASSENTIKNGSKTLGEYRSVQKRQQIIITPDITVNDLEQKFSELFGLGVQIFRKSGKAWLETTLTDKWTLKEQNNQGEELSSASA